MKRRLPFLILLIAGILLLLGGATPVLFRFVRMERTEAKAAEYAEQFEALIPETSPGTLEPISDDRCAMLEIDGCNFVGILEYDVTGMKLPIFASWDADLFGFRPAVLSGCAQNGTLVIGGRDSDSQFSFVDVIDVGAQMSFTDVYGRVFQYAVNAVNHTDSIDSVSDTEQADLTVFAKKSGRGYYVVRLGMIAR